MSPKEKIAKLEGLLARVKERAEAPRPHGAAAFPAQHANGEVAHAEPETTVAVAAAAAEPATPTAPPSASRAGTVPPVSAPPELESWSEPPPVTAADPVLETSVEETDEDYDADADVEVSAEVVEIDIDEPALMPAESGAQLVAEVSASAAPAELEEVHDEDEGATVEASEEEVPEELLAGASVPPAAPTPPPPANELVEPEPSSSPRPIASEKPEPYEAESAPRHTPPPESGKQVAAPSVSAPPARSSMPPGSLEGHTLIGGWREPGAAFGKGPAVRVPPPPPPPPAPAAAAPPPPPPPPPAPVAASAPPAAATSSVSPREPSQLTGPLSPSVTKAELPNAQVASFTGAVPTFAPASFGDLLDATLAL